VIIHPALNAGWITLHQYAVTLGRLDIEPNIVEVGWIEAEHRDVAEDNLSVGGRGSRGGKRATAHRLRRRHSSGLSVRKARALQPGWECFESRVQGHDLGPDVQADNIHQVDRPIIEAGPGCGCAVGDAAHFFEVFLLAPAHEEAVDE